MKVLMTKIPNERKSRYSLTTIIYEEKGKRYAMKRASSPDACAHLLSFREKAEKLRKYIINPKLQINKIIKITENEVIFEFVDGISLEKLMYDALAEHNYKKFLSYIDEYAALLKKSFKLKKYEEIEKELSGELRKLFKGRNFLYFNSGVPFDLIPSNIMKTGNGDYVVIDYEWSSSFPLPLEFIIFRGIYFSTEKYDLDVISSYLDISLFVKEITIEDFQVLDRILMNDISPHKRKNIRNLASGSDFIQRFAQLYVDTGNGFSESDSVKQLLDLNKREHTVSFSLDMEGIRNLRFDPVNIPCALKVNQISIFSGDREIYTMDSPDSNGIKTQDGVYFFNNDDPQIFLNSIPSDIMAEMSKITVDLEFIAYNKNALELYAQNAKELCTALYSTIENLNNKINSVAVRLHEASEKNHILNEALNKVQSELASKITQTDQIIESLEKRIRQKHLENTALQLKYENILKKLSAEEKNKIIVLKALRKEEQNASDLRKEADGLKSDLNKLYAEYEKYKNINDKKLLNLKAAINASSEKIKLLEKENLSLQESLQNTLNRTAALDEQLIQKDIIILQYRKSIHEFRTSRSWQMTAPYRALDSFIAKLLKGGKNG